MRTNLFIIVLWMLIATTLTGPVWSSFSVDNPHDGEEGSSIRHLTKRLLRSEVNGVGKLSDEDISLLFLRLLHEFNITAETTGESVMRINDAFVNFRRNVVRYAELEKEREERGDPLELAVNELAIVSEEEWNEMGVLGNVDVVAPFSLRGIRQVAPPPQGKIDWTASGLFPLVPVTLERIFAPMKQRLEEESKLLNKPNYLYGSVAMKARCLDYVYCHYLLARNLNVTSDCSAMLPDGGFAHLAASLPELAMSLRDVPVSADGVFRRKQLDISLEQGVQFRRRHREYVRPRMFADDEERRLNASQTNEERTARALRFLAENDIEFREVPAGNEFMLQAAVEQYGPVLVAIDARDPLLQFYRDGVYEHGSCQPRSPTHAFLVVGYKDDGLDPYWLVQAPWGASWGRGGIGKIRKGINACGIATNALYAALTRQGPSGGKNEGEREQER